MSGYVVCAVLGFLLGFLLCSGLVGNMLSGVTLDQCRAAHPGFDCDLGWVAGERFE